MKTTHMYAVGRFLLLAAAIYGTFLLAKFTLLHLYPFIIALLITLIIQPFVSLLEKRLHMPRLLAVILLLGAVVLFGVGTMVLIVAEIIQGTTHLAENIPRHLQLLVGGLERFFADVLLEPYQRLQSLFQSLNSNEQLLVQSQLMNLAKQLGAVLQQFLWQLPQWLLIVPSSLASLVLSLLAAFFMTNDWPKYRRLWRRHIPKKMDKHMQNLAHSLKKSFGGFLRAQFILLTATGLLVWLGLWILQVAHAPTIAILTVGVDLLPYAGTGLVFMPWIVYVFLAGQFDMAIGLSVLYMVIVLFRQLAEPKLLSSSMGMNPLALLFCLFLTLKLWGIVGLMLGPLLLVFLKAIREAGLFHEAWSFIRGKP